MSKRSVLMVKTLKPFSSRTTRRARMSPDSACLMMKEWPMYVAIVLDVP